VSDVDRSTVPAAPMPSSLAGAPAAADRISLRVAAGILFLLVLAGFALRADQMAFGLPHVLHSDFIQVPQAAHFLRDGSFVERSSYPATHTWAYVAADVAVYAVDRALGLGHWPGWDGFVAELQTSRLQHLIARLYTSALGSLLAVGVYLMARVRFPRGTSLLAAAVAALCPVFVIYSHQTRIHVPGITLLAFASVPMLRLVLLPAPATGSWRRAVAAGLAIGVVASVFQLGFVLLLSCGLLVACLVRPLPRMVREGALVLGACLLAFSGISAAAHWPGLVTDPPGQPLLADAATLGIPATAVRFEFLQHFPGFLSSYVLSEPVRVAAALLFVWACARGRRSWRDATAYFAYPVVMLLLLGVNYDNVRYSMSATAFLAVPAAAGVLALRRTAPRVALASLLLVAPLVSSVRYEWLLRVPDSRLALDEMLSDMPGGDSRIAVDCALVLDPRRLPANVVQFPPRGNFKPWFLENVSPRTTLQEARANLFVRSRGETLNGRLPDPVLETMGYWRCAIVDTGGDATVPDAPRALCLDLWRARRLGPSLEFWARTTESAAFMHRRARNNGLMALAR
jgi:hypothetical protein